MGKFWMTVLASLALVGFTAMVSAAAISEAAQPDAHADGRQMMIDAQYQLAKTLER